MIRLLLKRPVMVSYKSLSAGVATVDTELGTGHIAGGVTAEEGDRSHEVG